MADEDLLISAGVDLSDLRRQFAQAADLGRQFATALARAAGTTQIPTPRAEPARFAAAGQQAGAAFARGAAAGVEQQNAFAGLAAQARNAAAAITAAFSVRALAGFADDFTNFQNRLRTATGSVDAAAAAYRNLFGIAQSTRTDLGATVDLYAKLALATRNAGVSTQDLQAFTRTLSQSFAVAGTSAEDAARIIRQFGQALGRGQLLGDELISLREGAPQVVKAIQEVAGATDEAFAKMASDGQISVDLILRALRRLGPETGAQFAELTPTIGGGFTQLRNAVTDYIGSAGQANGTSRTLAVSLGSIAQNFDTVAGAATAAAAVLAARTLGGNASRIAADARAQIAAYREQQAALVQASFARQADTAAAQAAATRDTAATQQRIANLRALEAELARATAAERARLAASAVTLNRAQSTPLANLAPLGSSIVEREARARAAAEGVAANASRALLQIDTQRARVSGLLAAETRALAIAEGQQAAASTAVTATSTAHAAALARTGVAATASAVATRAAAAAYAGVGGGVGVAILAVTGLVWWFNRQKAAAEQARQTIENWKVSLASLPIVEVEANVDPARRALAVLDAEVARLKREIAATDVTAVVREGQELSGANNPIARLAAQLRVAEAGANAAREGLRGLEQAQTAFNRASGRTGQTTAALDAEIKSLAARREAGDLFAREQQRITEIVRQAQAERSRILAQPLPDDAQAAGRVTARLQELRQQIDALTAPTRADRAITADLKLETREAREAFREFQQQTEDTVLRIRLAADAGRTADLPLLTRELQVQYDRVTAAIAAQGGPLFANVQLLQQQRDLLTAIGEAARRAIGSLRLEPITLTFTVSDTLTKAMRDQVTAAVRAANLAAADVDIADAVGDPARISAANAALAQARAELDRINAAAARYAATLAPEARHKFWQTVRGDVEGARQAIDQATGSAISFRDRMEAIADSARGVLQIADAFGRVDEGVRRAVDGITGLVGSFARAGAELERIRKERQKALDALADATDTPAGKATAGIGDLFKTVSGFASLVGIIGGAVGVISSLFNRGPSPVEIALKHNAETLDRLRAELQDFRSTFAQLDLVRDASIQISADPRVLREIVGAGIGIRTRAESIDAVDQAARALGTSFAQLQAIAEQNGIDLLDSKGRVVAGAFDQLAEAMELVRQNALRLDETFGAVVDRLGVRDDLFNLDDSPVQRFNRQIEALAATAPDIARLFDGITVDTVAGQRAATEMLQRLFEQATASNASALQLLKDTGFESVEEFVRFLSGADDALDALRDSADSATQALTSLGNVPEAFKRSLDTLRFQVQQIAAPVVPVVTVPAPTPTPLPVGGFGGAAASTSAPQIVQVYQFAEGAIVVPGAIPDGATLLDEVDSALVQRARQRGGVNHPAAAGLLAALTRAGV